MRDDLYLARSYSAEGFSSSSPRWFDDYNAVDPHKSLKMRSPRDFRLASSFHCPIRFDGAIPPHGFDAHHQKKARAPSCTQQDR
ncbi:hypothetical protein [Myxococcus faecalis]|uniref:hypothetical protein n=1 Tax=Myxococcus faecalis TaxID=3115646 RepID=UPI003CF69DFA